MSHTHNLYIKVWTMNGDECWDFVNLGTHGGAGSGFDRFPVLTEPELVSRSSRWYDGQRCRMPGAVDRAIAPHIDVDDTEERIFNEINETHNTQGTHMIDRSRTDDPINAVVEWRLVERVTLAVSTTPTPEDTRFETHAEEAAYLDGLQAVRNERSADLPYATYHPHHREHAEGYIYLNREGACTITLQPAMSMPQSELDIFASAMCDGLNHGMAHYEEWPSGMQSQQVIESGAVGRLVERGQLARELNALGSLISTNAEGSPELDEELLEAAEGTPPSENCESCGAVIRIDGDRDITLCENCNNEEEADLAQTTDADDLCDQCMRSGTEISHTDSDGNTICVNCASDAEEAAYLDGLQAVRIHLSEDDGLCPDCFGTCGRCFQENMRLVGHGVCAACTDMVELVLDDDEVVLQPLDPLRGGTHPLKDGEHIYDTGNGTWRVEYRLVHHEVTDRWHIVYNVENGRLRVLANCEHRSTAMAILDLVAYPTVTVSVENHRPQCITVPADLQEFMLCLVADRDNQTDDAGGSGYLTAATNEDGEQFVACMHELPVRSPDGADNLDRIVQEYLDFTVSSYSTVEPV